jgi:hypothetical protein
MGYFLERVTRIQELMKPQTLQKALIAAEYIQRRYSFLYASLLPPLAPSQPVAIARWNAEQDSPYVSFLLPCAESDINPSQKSHVQIALRGISPRPTVEEYLKVQAQQEEPSNEPRSSFTIADPKRRFSQSRSKNLFGHNTPGFKPHFAQESWNDRLSSIR